MMWYDVIWIIWCDLITRLIMIHDWDYYHSMGVTDSDPLCTVCHTGPHLTEWTERAIWHRHTLSASDWVSLCHSVSLCQWLHHTSLTGRLWPQPADAAASRSSFVTRIVSSHVTGLDLKTWSTITYSGESHQNCYDLESGHLGFMSSSGLYYCSNWICCKALTWKFKVYH